MNSKLKTNHILDERSVITSRRSFLKNVAWGSLLVVGGSTAVEAAAKHVAKAPVKTATKASAKAATKQVASKQTTAKQSHVVSVAHTDKHKAAKHEVAKHEITKSHTGKHHEVAKSHADKHHAGKHELAKRETHHDHHLAEQHHTPHTSPHRISQQISTKHHHHAQPAAPVQQVAKREPEYDVYDEDEQYDDIESDDDGNISYDDEPMKRIYRPAFFGNTLNHRELVLQNAHIDNITKLTYFEKGQYLPDALDEISYLFQDHMTGDTHPIDVALLDQLHDLKQTLGVSNSKPIHIVCGYRSPMTNAYLRSRSRAVAKNSLHMQGRAIDIRMEGVSSRNIRDAALTMARGGVGYYPRSNFVHLDTGGFRTW